MYTTAPRMANSTIMIHNRINLFVAILEKKKKNHLKRFHILMITCFEVREYEA